MGCIAYVTWNLVSVVLIRVKASTELNGYPQKAHIVYIKSSRDYISKSRYTKDNYLPADKAIW